MSSTTPRCLTHDQYSIGIICPLGDELAAVEAMLDQIDTTLPTAVAGSAYTLGSIGDHNVVVAVLPRSGEASAAWTGAKLLRNFPSIKFGLLVGIGGGVPGDDEEHDVRLGDVVVSYASGTFGGVVQYSFGKMRAGWKFERTGSIDSPPPGVTAQVNKLRARHIREGSQIPVYLDAMVKRYPRMATYSRPKNSPDRLFQTSYSHVTEDKNCSRCESQYLVARANRASDEPVVFYGVIGSGDQVVRNPELRDQLKREYGILCVDMEAAGLMHDFPCLVIRGISDYADSHKNDTFKRYAAATAAAYMKELLLIMPSQDVRYIPTAPKQLQDAPVTLSPGSNENSTERSKRSEKNPQEPFNKTPYATTNHHPVTSINQEKSNGFNILVLGEVGAGKSTFINAFVNYLHHGSLDAALHSDKLIWTVPSSFVVLTRDQKAGGSIVENKITVGPSRRAWHEPVKGQSSTQKAFVHHITVGSATYNLIDTPGVGDVRGTAFDEQVILDSFNAINMIEELHGIVILVKASIGRLVYDFEMHMKGLLTHLHRDAAKNIVFVFTDTRIQKYVAGETYFALRSLLRRETEIDISSNSNLMYCVDSEGFTFIAAAHQGVEMENKEAFRQSWQKSSEEMKRMVGHFRTVKPHTFKHTLDLDRKRGGVAVWTSTDDSERIGIRWQW